MTRNSGKDPAIGAMHREASPSNLDAAIDDAVRAMTGVDADGSFRARVLDRIEQRRRRRGLGPRLMLGAAAFAAVVLAVVLSRPGGSENSVRTNGTVAVKERVTPPTQPPSAVEAARPERETTPPVGERPARRVRADVQNEVPPDAIVAAVAEDTSQVEIVPLTELTPIGITPLEQAPIAPAEIAIAPLTPMPEVRVAPLSPLTERE
jgi:hypothetical protein